MIHDYRGREYEAILGDSEKISIVEGPAALTDPHAVPVNGRSLRGEHILVATGSRPAVPPIPGLDAVPYLASDLLISGEPMEMTEQPRSFVISGAGTSAWSWRSRSDAWGATSRCSNVATRSSPATSQRSGSRCTPRSPGKASTSGPKRASRRRAEG